MQILEKTEEMVYPAADDSHPELHRLSEVDQLMSLRFPLPILYFYRQGPVSTEALKSSLSKTLAIFYPLAGRLQPRSRVRETRPDAEKAAEGAPAMVKAASEWRVDVSCLEQGALFCEAWTDARLDAYEPDFQPHPDFQRLLVPDHHDVPLRVQVTHFSCGGSCIAIQAFHNICDGASNAHFMESWAELAVGKDSPTVLPFISSTPLEIMYEPSEVNEHSLEEYATYHRLIQPNEKWSPPSGTILNRIFNFTPTFFDTQTKSSHDEDNVIKYSTFEWVAAYLWKNVTKARGIDANGEVSLFYVVNGRRRFNPPLPASYLGNVAFPTKATALVSDLLEKPLLEIVQLIRAASKRATDEHMRGLLKWSTMQSQPVSNRRFVAPDLFITSWKDFPLCSYDFGWGTPITCRPSLHPMEAIVLLPSPLGKKHMEVLVSLNDHSMSRFASLIKETLPLQDSC